MPETANPDFDLTTVDAVKSWLSSNGMAGSSTTDDGNIQALITAASIYWLVRTGRGPADGSVPQKSPLVEQVQYNEWYDGNGSQRLFVRNSPIASVQLLMIGNITIPQSNAYNVPGFVVDGSGKSIALRAGGGGSGTFSFTSFASGGCGYVFWKGLQNVNVQYTAGFNGTPADIEIACRTMVGVNYQRARRRDQSSQAMAAGAGTISFKTDWIVPPEVAQVIRNYSRTAIA